MKAHMSRLNGGSAVHNLQSRSPLRNLLCAALLTMGPLTASSLPAQDMLLQNAQIVDVEARTVRSGNILITAGRIAGFPAQPPANYTGVRLDLGGLFVMPALSDMHTHSFGNSAVRGMPEMLGTPGVARVALAAGVARFLDLFSAEFMILRTRNEQRAGQHPGAEIFAAGPCLTATRGHCSEYGIPTRIVNSPADAVREVNALAANKPDVVKVVYDHQSYGGRTLPTIDRATLAAVVETARANGLKTVVHIGTWDDLRDAVEVGAAAVTHTPGPTPVPADVVTLMKERGVFFIPTLAVQSDYARFLDNPSLLDSKLLARSASAALIDGFRTAPDSASPFRAFVTWQREISVSNMRSVAAIHQAGVPLLTGTDGGNPAIFQGYSVHRELQLFVEAGLSPWDAIAASSTRAGEFLGRNWGMNVGAEATLLVLAGSPISDIRNSEQIVYVIQRGTMVYDANSTPPQ